MDKKKILILSQTDREDYALQEWKKNGVSVGITLKEQPKLLRGLRRIWIKFHLPFQSIWYGTWKREFLNYDCILLHGTWLAEDIPHWMQKQAKKQQKQLKIIWWYWNKVVSLDHPDAVSEKDCEKWSFDKADCQRYHMKYNTQYYFKSFELPKVPIKHDVYYLGSDGGRLKQIIEIEKLLKQQGITTDFHILVSQIPKEMEAYQDSFLTKKVAYQENLKHIAESKGILEILREGQSGQTLRPLEALFFQKKLITNDTQIKNYAYYHPHNIFILGEDRLEELSEFLDKPFVPIASEIVEKYDCQKWMERFALKQ